jgi:hypothetical protein
MSLANISMPVATVTQHRRAKPTRRYYASTVAMG